LKFDVLQFSCVLRISICVRLVSLLLSNSRECLFNQLRTWWASIALRQAIEGRSASASFSVTTLVKSAKGFDYQGEQWRY
jgi:hypothetical protein